MDGVATVAGEDMDGVCLGLSGDYPSLHRRMFLSVHLPRDLFVNLPRNLLVHLLW